MKSYLDLAPPPRLYQNVFMDGTRWSAVVPRDGDIVIATPPKAGTPGFRRSSRI